MSLGFSPFLDEDLQSLISIDYFLNDPSATFRIREFCPVIEPQENTNRTFSQPNTVVGGQTQPTYVPIRHSSFAMLQSVVNSYPFGDTSNSVNAERDVMKKRKPKKLHIPSRKIEQTGECPICLLNMRKSTKIPHLSCDHEFHRKCLMDWMKRQESCPLCRIDLSGNPENC